MLEKFQPHINIVEFTILWKQLDIILQAEFMSRLIVDLYVNAKPIGLISDYRYDMISSYFAQIKKLNQTDLFAQLLKDYIQMLETNKYIMKLNLPIEANQISTCEELVNVAQYVVSTVPEAYSSLLPL